MPAATGTSKWICSELSKLLGFDASEDIAEYIGSMQSARDLEDYLCDLLDASQPKHRRFIDELLSRFQQSTNDQQTPQTVPQNVQVYRKPELDSEVATNRRRSGKKNSRLSDAAIAVDDHTNSASPQENKISPGKSKTKFVKLFNETGDVKTVAQLPGRHACECQGHKHGLVNNCVVCGRVVCAQEGSGPCLFCGSLVCTRQEEEVLARGSKKSEKLRQTLLDRPRSSADHQKQLEAAVKHKEKLLNYDSTSAKRTQVIDDESDYFATDSNTWLSKKERESLKKREDEVRSARHASRSERRVTLDFAGRRVLEAHDEVPLFTEQPSQPEQTSSGHLINPDVEQFSIVPKFVGGGGAVSHDPWPAPDKKRGLRIQDSDLQQMTDEGVCLSMHQPWASLLVAGIKKHEGRSWYTAHRGRLWIAATSQQVSTEDITALENHYSALYDEPLDFPRHYPSGCLLGCVDLTDCLNQEQYSEQYPSGECSSPYVFICSDPHVLLVKFPMKGKHKIYNLDRHIHQGAKKGLQPVTGPGGPS